MDPDLVGPVQEPFRQDAIVAPYQAQKPNVTSLLVVFPTGEVHHPHQDRKVEPKVGIKVLPGLRIGREFSIFLEFP